MAIQLRYQPAADQLAAISQATGQGVYQQSQDRLALEQEAIAQRERQFLAQLGQQREIAALGANQQNRQLGAQMYQFDATRQDRAAMAEMDVASRFQQELMRQQGFADMREAEAEKQGSDQRFRLSQEQSRIKQHFQDQQFNAAMAAAQEIEKQKSTMFPEMYEQALQQWTQRYGDVAGDYPFVGGQQSAMSDDALAEADTVLTGMFGDKVTREMKRAYAEMSGEDQLQFQLAASKASASERKAQEQLDVSRENLKLQQEKHVYDIEQDKVSKEQARAQDILNHQQQLQITASKARLDAQLAKINAMTTAMGKVAAAADGGQGTIDTMQSGIQAELAKLDAMANELMGGATGGATQPQQQSSTKPPRNSSGDYLVSGKQDAATLEVGETFLAGGKRWRVTGPGQAEPIE